MLANLSPAEKAMSKDEVVIEKFLQGKKSKNTQYETMCDLNSRAAKGSFVQPTS